MHVTLLDVVESVEKCHTFRVGRTEPKVCQHVVCGRHSAVRKSKSGLATSHLGNLRELSLCHLLRPVVLVVVDNEVVVDEVAMNNLRDKDTTNAVGASRHCEETNEECLTIEVWSARDRIVDECARQSLLELGVGGHSRLDGQQLTRQCRTLELLHVVGAQIRFDADVEKKAVATGVLPSPEEGLELLLGRQLADVAECDVEVVERHIDASARRRRVEEEVGLLALNRLVDVARDGLFDKVVRPTLHLQHLRLEVRLGDVLMNDRQRLDSGTEEGDTSTGAQLLHQLVEQHHEVVVERHLVRARQRPLVLDVEHAQNVTFPPRVAERLAHQKVSERPQVGVTADNDSRPRQHRLERPHDRLSLEHLGHALRRHCV